MHVNHDPSHPTVVGDDVTVGHAAILHGCTIEDRCLIGMGAILLNGSHVGSDSIVAAGTLVPGAHGHPAAVAGHGQSRQGQAHAHRTTELAFILQSAPPTTCDTGSTTWISDRDEPRMTAAQTQPARGMRDFLPDDVRRREYVIGVIADVYERYGFEPLETPAVENIETLIGKYGEEGDRLIFKILKRGEHEHTGEADLALRYDLTVPLARVVAEHRGTLPQFFKRYQVQPVWRADRPERGRFREFYQCDVDVVGSTSPVVEVGALFGGQRRAGATRVRATSRSA